MVTNIFNILKTKSKTYTPIPSIWSRPSYFIAFGLGSGLIPIASGTFGTLMAIPIYLLLAPLPLYAYLLFVFAFVIFSSWLADKVSRELQTHDHPGMNIDEFAGYFVTMIAAPIGWIWVLLGFLLFRLFDVWKPWPIRLIDERIHGGFGMIFDDVVAGLYAMIILQIIHGCII